MENLPKTLEVKVKDDPLDTLEISLILKISVRRVTPGMEILLSLW